MVHRFKSSIGFLASAAMLTGSLIPPGYVHAHAKGKIPHEHGQAQHVDHGHAHSGRHRHSHAHHGHAHHGHAHHGHAHHRDAKERDYSRSLSINPASVAHIHLTLFWFDFTLPASNPTDSKGPQPKTPLLFYSASLLDEGISASDDGSADRQNCAFRTAPESVDSLLPEQPTMPDAPLCHSHRCLLCDTARHERSGVQLF